MQRAHSWCPDKCSAFVSASSAWWFQHAYMGLAPLERTVGQNFSQWQKMDISLKQHQQTSVNRSTLPPYFGIATEPETTNICCLSTMMDRRSIRSSAPCRKAWYLSQKASFLGTTRCVSSVRFVCASHGVPCVSGPLRFVAAPAMHATQQVVLEPWRIPGAVEVTSLQVAQVVLTVSIDQHQQ